MNRYIYYGWTKAGQRIHLSTGADAYRKDGQLHLKTLCSRTMLTYEQGDVLEHVPQRVTEVLPQLLPSAGLGRRSRRSSLSGLIKNMVEEMLA